MDNRAGSYRKNLSGEFEYLSFMPASLPPNPPIEMDQETIDLLIKASKTLAVLDGLAARVPDVALFISMYVRKEALLSSQIEGTQATLEDVFDPMLDENTNREVADVINYIKAMEYAIRRLKELPLCNRLIRETHAVLMSGVRGQDKAPGEFRRSQNWIGGFGSTLKAARYIPPNLPDMQEAISDLEKYINAEDKTDLLIQACLVHYQFEAIHPFLDGNGRIGRLLITLFLMQKGVLSSPVLYISYFLKQNRTEYYDRLMEVRNKGDYEQWVKFFLEAVYQSAEDAVNTIDQLTALHDRSLEVVKQFGRSAKNALRMFEYIEKNPIIEINKTAGALGLSYNTISSIVRKLVDVNILAQVGNMSRNRIFTYTAYLDILRKGT
jgi:Fic family protein